ncbi:MAG: Mucin related 82C [Microgenomates group bacterium GW2011_GWC1_44_37]|nr:MAG: Mucin related 82C [Microgenomates group bacterium GW2011_GWC1_44_37]
MDPQNPLNQSSSQPLTPDPITPDPILTPPPSSFASPLPVAPFTPENNIPPVSEPFTPVTTTTTTTPSETMTSTVTPSVTPLETIAPVTSTTTTTTTTPTPLPEAPAEAQWSEQKPKSKTPQILMGVLALFLVVGAAVGAYFVSSRVSSRQAVAPTAPESEPLASSSDCSNITGACKGLNEGDTCGTNKKCRTVAPGTLYSCICETVSGGSSSSGGATVCGDVGTSGKCGAEGMGVARLPVGAVGVARLPVGAEGEVVEDFHARPHVQERYQMERVKPDCGHCHVLTVAVAVGAVVVEDLAQPPESRQRLNFPRQERWLSILSLPHNFGQILS